MADKVDKEDQLQEQGAEEIRSTRGMWCCRQVKGFFTLVPEGATPVNYTVLFTVVLALFGSAYSITFLFPFLPDMVLYFGYKEEEKGYYAGFIAAGMFAGRVFGSFFWGWMSDRYGRRPIMLITTMAVGVTNIAFGFSTNIYMAVAMRFINGLFNGLVGTVKTVLYEISDDTNQAAGMSGIAMAWGSGVVIGPLISGFVSSPAKKYPNAFPEGSLLDKFPFLLPSLFAFFMSLVGFVVVWFKLPETLPSKMQNPSKESEAVAESLLAPQPAESTTKPTLANEDTTQDPCVQLKMTKSKSTTQIAIVPSGATQSPEGLRRTILSKSLNHLHASAKYEDVYDIYGLGQPLGFSQQILSQSQSSVTSTKSISALPNGNADTLTNGVSMRNGVPHKANGHTELDLKMLETRVVHSNGKDPVTRIESGNTEEEKPHKQCCLALKEWTLCRLLRQRDVLISIMLYSVMSFDVVAFEELFIVWASTENRLGGLGLSAAKIGAAIGGSSSGLLIIQVFLYPKLVTRFGPLRVLQASLLYLIFFSAVIQCLRYLDNASLLLWVILVISMGIQKMCMTSAFSSVSLFINNSVTPADAGSVNGIGMTFSAVFRTMAPMISGSMFAWSITEGTNIGFPFDVNLAFIFTSVVFLISNILTALTPRRLEKQKKREAQ